MRLVPKIACTVDGFPEPFAAANGAYDLELTWPFIVWSAITVGRAELMHVFRHGEFSLFEIAYRAAILFANLCDDWGGGVRAVMFLHVTRVSYLQSYEIELEFSDGLVKKVDLSKDSTGRYSSL